MSLATRCPACSTVFRVVQDQLRVSEGWVRCGQCQEVFNALETLFDLGDADEAPANESGTAGAGPAAAGLDAGEAHLGEFVSEGPLPEDHWSPSPAPAPVERTPPPDAPAIESTLPAPVAPSASLPSHAAAPPTAPSTAIEAAPDKAPAAAPAEARDLRLPSPVPEPVAEADAEEPTPSRFIGPVPDWARQPSRGRRSGKSRRTQARLAAATGHGAETPHVHAHQSPSAHRRRRKPDFVRQAERAALWRRPAIRAVLGSAAVVLGVMLVLQVAYEYREPLAAQVPALAPALHAGCEQLGCRIGAPRAIERIRLDASDLTRTEQAQVLRFTAELHNSADFAVRAPALDLSFTDALGRVVSRKVLQPTELGLRGEAIDADAQWRVDARLAVGELQIAGYTVEAFYP
ncbi:DUF3426 domain-containing protein [Ideonella sp.]|uniref:DUF3426 domain-containing protein n=1 Tax=Ideonella sp. TaxID=1929293 RepID=UPI002B478459|nr:DUF3426 domain-containing protein [Ideonella sp.]HJV68526.1 DUF3426 domain-containing protein [Ideonella sp.]